MQGILRTIVIIVMAASPAYPDAQTGGLLERLTNAAQDRPPLPRPAANTPQPAPHTYAFAAFAQEPPERFFEALHRLIADNPPPADLEQRAAYSRDLAYKARLLFAYYPLAADGRQDVQALLDVVYDISMPAAVRTYFLRQAGPGLEPRSAMGGYLQGHLAFQDAEFEERLRELIQMPQENVAVQLAAMEVLLARTEAAYASLLARDSRAREHARAHGPLHVRQLLEAPDAIPLERRTEILMQRENETAGKWAKALQALANNAQRKAPVREKARRVLAELIENYPIASRESLTETP